ncbi:hypothetical protein EMPS_09724 [Entomortierella parvispora]|uniref:Thc1 RRM domain-containing protein n=1 Tax=Entomortierella parvispora TaxID=205924 RepID=A0A9P3M0V4_9FUNG|nr:hypothetical protein EMPS_09724 [Entomortierella parvispora]
MSDSGSSANQGRRTPKVGVYVPRHRRGGGASGGPSNPTSPSPANDPGDSDLNSGSSSPWRGSSTPTGTEDGSRSGNSSASSDVQRRGRGKFMGPGGGNGGNPGSSGAGGSTGGGGNGWRHGRDRTMSSQPQRDLQQPAVPRHAPRGRDFDATVLRRYSDDENRPGSSFSRSNSYNNTRSTTIGNSNSAGQDQSSHDGSASKNRSDARSWRREEVPSDEAGLVEQLDRLNVDDRSSKGDAESSEELEDWEVAAAQQSDNDNGDEAAPRIVAPKPKHAERPHPAEILMSSGSSGSRSSSPKLSKVGNWSDIVNDDMYILELYGFSSSIKTMHLTDMFSAYENRAGGFRIKWVDDTKALVIFESAAVAKQAYAANVNNSIAKIKPYTGADKDTIRNEGKPSSGAYNGARPQKTDSVARRLVQGALGLRVRRTPEQIAEEKALLQAAKDARHAQREEERRQRETMDAVFNS